VALVVGAVRDHTPGATPNRRATSSVGNDHTLTEELSSSLDDRSLTAAIAAARELEKRLVVLRAHRSLTREHASTTRNNTKTRLNTLPVLSLLGHDLTGSRLHLESVEAAAVGADTTASAIHGAHLDAETHAGHLALALLGLHALSLLLSKDERTDGSVRAEERALVALNALSGVPLGDGSSDTTLLEASGTHGVNTLLHEDGDRKVITLHAVGRADNLLDEVRDRIAALLNNEEVLVADVGPCGRDLNLVKTADGSIDSADVHVDDLGTLDTISALDSLLEELESLVNRKNTRETEEHSLHDSVNTTAKADALGDLGSVDSPELDLLASELTLHLGRNVLLELLLVPGAVKSEDTTLLNVLGHIVSANIRREVAGKVVSFDDEVLTADGSLAETKVTDSQTTALVSIIEEVTLDVLISVITDDLDSIVVSTDSTISTKTPEHALGGALRDGVELRAHGDVEVSAIIEDIHGEVVLGLLSLQVLEDSADAARSVLLATETITATDDVRMRLNVVEGHDDIEEERLTRGSGLLSTLDDSDALDALGDSLKEVLSAPWAEETDLDETPLLALLLNEGVESLLSGGDTSTHHDDDALRLGVTVVLEDVVLTAEDLLNLSHVLLDDLRELVVEVVMVLLILEEDIRALNSTNEVGVERVKSTVTETLDSLTIDHLSDSVVLRELDLADLVRSAETIEEVHERHTTLKSREVSDESHIRTSWTVWELR